MALAHPLNEQKATGLSFMALNSHHRLLCAFYTHHPIEGVPSSQLKITLNYRLCQLQKKAARDLHTRVTVFTVQSLQVVCE